MKYRFAYSTSVGGRRNQEDCLFINGEALQDDDLAVLGAETEGEALLFAVCDGMGGHASGEKASRFVCERLPSDPEGFPPTPAGAGALLGGIQRAMEGEPAGEGGTTIAGVAVRGRSVLVFTAGDSRVYRLSPAGIARITRDHSLVQQYLDRGELTPAEAFDHPYRNVITFGLGAMFAAEWAAGKELVHCSEEELAPGVSYLLCSDGVSDVLRDGEIRDALGGDAVDGAARLLERLSGNMSDNTSFICVAGG